MTTSIDTLRTWVSDNFKHKYTGGSTLMGGRPIFPDYGGEPLDGLVDYIKQYSESKEGKALCPTGVIKTGELIVALDKMIPTADTPQTLTVLRIAATLLPADQELVLNDAAKMRTVLEPL